MTESTAEQAPKHRSTIALTIFCGLLFVVMCAVFALGVWQLERRAWKLDLIARIDQRINAEPTAAPARAEWEGITKENDEYRRVTAEGTLQSDKESLVYSATELGAGYWVIAPLTLADGTSVMINRGFVPTNKRDVNSRSDGRISGPIKITGLLRLNEPGGTFIRSNDPANDRWYSRDVDAMAAKRGVADIAPYFIDADATANPGGLPVGGLTQVSFPNNHLQYALTWFALAAMLAGLLVYVLRSELRQRG
ncbi:SURF1 family protein [Rhizobium sp. AN80A]|uniref:SURF1 family protein n=1 Tax=Rhizobium sp. AN80A TaxID=3040673 RepID=UPI0024B32820|nr:SURF1 family protein [Rhizobium sp. AN80A]